MISKDNDSVVQWSRTASLVLYNGTDHIPDTGIGGDLDDIKRVVADVPNERERRRQVELEVIAT